ncbi:hypothetical protein LTR27_012474 [Elasticomyces elasticus]|nr:hypothetical protein LTR27_012474 [Elasticomyces elasticus]
MDNWDNRNDAGWLDRALAMEGDTQWRAAGFSENESMMDNWDNRKDAGRLDLTLAMETDTHWDAAGFSESKSRMEDWDTRNHAGWLDRALAMELDTQLRAAGFSDNPIKGYNLYGDLSSASADGEPCLSVCSGSTIASSFTVPSDQTTGLDTINSAPFNNSPINSCFDAAYASELDHVTKDHASGVDHQEQIAEHATSHAYVAISEAALVHDGSLGVQKHNAILDITAPVSTIVCYQGSHAPRGRQATKILKCGLCMSNKLFDRRFELERHMATHFPGGYPCPLLDCRFRGAKAFKRADKLRDHLRITHGLVVG